MCEQEIRAIYSTAAAVIESIIANFPGRIENHPAEITIDNVSFRHFQYSKFFKRNAFFSGCFFFLFIACFHYAE